MFLLLRVPHSLHNDNGAEFTAAMIIELKEEFVEGFGTLYVSTHIIPRTRIQ